MQTEGSMRCFNMTSLETGKVESSGHREEVNVMTLSAFAGLEF